MNESLESRMRGNLHVRFGGGLMEKDLSPVARTSLRTPVSTRHLASFLPYGVAAIQGSIDHVRAGANPRLTVLGFLLTMFQKSLAVHAGYAADLRAIYGDAVFETVVPHAKDFKESVMLRKPVVAYKPRSAAAKAIDALADELLARLDARVADEPRRVA